MRRVAFDMAVQATNGSTTILTKSKERLPTGFTGSVHRPRSTIRTFVEGL